MARSVAEIKAEIAALQGNVAAPTRSVAEIKAEIAALQGPKPAYLSPIESAVRGAGQGFTAGWGDEIMGRVAQATIALTGNNDLFEGDIYKQARNEIRSDNASAQEAYPGTYGVSEFAGALAPALATGGASTGLQAAAKAGAYGATIGAGQANESEDMLEDALKTGLLTATGGVIINKAGQLVNKAGSGLLKKAEIVKPVAVKPRKVKVGPLEGTNVKGHIRPGREPGTAESSETIGNIIKDKFANMKGEDLIAGGLGFYAGGVPGAVAAVGGKDVFKAAISNKKSATLSRLYQKYGDRLLKYADRIQQASVAGPVAIAALESEIIAKESVIDNPGLLTKALQQKVDQFKEGTQ